METFFALLAICAGNSPVTGELPAQRPATRSFDVLSALRLNKRSSKQSWGWWFETPSRPLWRHCNTKNTFLEGHIIDWGNRRSQQANPVGFGWNWGSNPSRYATNYAMLFSINSWKHDHPLHELNREYFIHTCINNRLKWLTCSSTGVGDTDLLIANHMDTLSDIQHCRQGQRSITWLSYFENRQLWWQGMAQSVFLMIFSTDDIFAKLYIVQYGYKAGDNPYCTKVHCNRLLEFSNAQAVLHNRVPQNISKLNQQFLWNDTYDDIKTWKRVCTTGPLRGNPLDTSGLSDAGFPCSFVVNWTGCMTFMWRHFCNRRILWTDKGTKMSLSWWEWNIMIRASGLEILNSRNSKV